MPVKHPDGNWSGQGNYTNFAAVLDEMGSRKTTKNDFWNTLALKLTPLKGLTINMDYTFNYYAEHGKVHRKTFNEYGIDGKFLQVSNTPGQTACQKARPMTHTTLSTCLVTMN